MERTNMKRNRLKTTEEIWSGYRYSDVRMHSRIASHLAF
ncbi:hypothetical protein S7335_440 [Synechococcus sp. PCC 7335]|nr:hypothetical protein S7335_440 [Synechococcus sp. PCC 7335]